MTVLGTRILSPLEVVLAPEPCPLNGVNGHGRLAAKGAGALPSPVRGERPAFGAIAELEEGFPGPVHDERGGFANLQARLAFGLLAGHPMPESVMGAPVPRDHAGVHFHRQLAADAAVGQRIPRPGPGTHLPAFRTERRPEFIPMAKRSR